MSISHEAPDKHLRLSVSALKVLMEETTEKAVEAIQRHGGIVGIAAALDVKLDKGLHSQDTSDLEARRLVYGVNRLPAPKPKGLLFLMWAALKDPVLIILMVAGCTSLTIGMIVEEDKSHAWIEGFLVLVAVAIVVLSASLNDWKKERQFHELNKVKEDYNVNVLRNGISTQISRYDILVGDILLLAQGDEVEADGIVVEASGLKINESSLTGESDDIKKTTTTHPQVFGGTQVMDGAGRMLVLAVGTHTQAGLISELISGRRPRPATGSASSDTDTSLETGTAVGMGKKDGVHQQPTDATVIDTGSHATLETNHKATPVEQQQEEEEEEGEGTPLQNKLTRMMIAIGYIGLTVAILTFVVMSVRFSIETYTTRGFESRDLRQFVDFFIVAITVLIVSIPEGLPLAVTLSLAFSMKRMLKENNLVRHLDACETMGNATAICSDKTGTLTMNRMAVVRATIANQQVDPTRPLSECGVSRSVEQLVAEGVAINSAAEVRAPASGVGTVQHVGSKTECALLEYIQAQGFAYAALRANVKPACVFPFSSARKSSSVVLPATIELGRPGYRLHTKGASEMVLERCTHIVDAQGVVCPLDNVTRAQINATIVTYATESLRTLCLAYRDISDNLAWEEIGSDQLEQGLILLALVGIEDPLRPEVPGAITQCRRAGITVRMVTGDNVITATSIAKKCGILSTPEDLVMEGPTFRKRVLDASGNIIQSEIDKIWPRLRVLARSSPSDKYTLVAGMLASTQGEKQVVAVTGDGTNDAPALKRADVGFAMGIQGTSVAKNASDIILMDDNFNSIVVAVKWGRNVYDSVAKFVQFQLTVNLVALILAFTSACIIKQSPLTATQLLWISLVFDTLAALALATERPTDALLDRKPYGRDKLIISRRMGGFIVGHGIFQLTLCYFLTFYGHVLFGLDNGKGQEASVHYTLVFNTFTFCQFFNEINARKLKGEVNVFAGFLRNNYFLVIMAIQITLQVVLVQFGSILIGAKPLPLKLWLASIGFASIALPWNLLLKSVNIFLPRSVRQALTRPLSRKFWVRGWARYRGVPMPTKRRDTGRPRHSVILRDPQSARNMDMYESTLVLMLQQAKSPGQRLRTAARLVTYRHRREEARRNLVF